MGKNLKSGKWWCSAAVGSLHSGLVKLEGINYKTSHMKYRRKVRRGNFLKLNSDSIAS